MVTFDVDIKIGVSKYDKNSWSEIVSHSHSLPVWKWESLLV